MLKKLILAPSPSGYELPVIKVIEEFAEGFADQINLDAMNSVHVWLNGRTDLPTLMLASHIDEVGLIVKYIDDHGYVYFDSIGNVDPIAISAMPVEIHSAHGVVHGVVGRKPIHFITEADKSNITFQKLFIDVGMSRDAAEQLISIGDAVTFQAIYSELKDCYIVGRGLDDKAGVWVSLELLRRLSESKIPHGNICFAGTSQEELGLRGGITSTYSINADLGVCVEVINATDYPDVDMKQYGAIYCGKGPVLGRGPNIHPLLFEYMLEAAKLTNLNYQIAAEPRATGTDANAIQISRGGIMAGLISIPLRYMHTPIEMINIKDLSDAVSILLKFIELIQENKQIVPRCCQIKHSFPHH